MIRTTADGPVRVVTLDRPDRRNALRPADLDELPAAESGADPEAFARRHERYVDDSRRTRGGA